MRKRTQLKRSVYRVLGEPEEEDPKPEGDSADQSELEPERDSHLKDYNENIFDDDDFYHQVGAFMAIFEMFVIVGSVIRRFHCMPPTVHTELHAHVVVFTL